MAPRLVPLCAALWMLAGCQRHSTTQSRGAEPSASAKVAEGTAAPPTAADSHGGAAVPPPALLLSAGARDRAFTVSVQNHAPAQVELAPALIVERRTERGFEPLASAAIALGQAGAQGCVALVPGAELRPRWPGASAPAPGTYRLIARACDDSYRVEGAPFDVR